MLEVLVFYRPADVGSLLLSWGGCLGQKGPVLKAGAIDAYVAMRSPALLTSEREMKKAKMVEDRAGRSLFLPTP